MSQRQLIDEIKFLLDTSCDDCRHARCARNLAALATTVADNPTSTFSTKVMYNIGVRRYARLTRALEAASDRLREEERAGVGRGLLPRGSEALVGVSLAPGKATKRTVRPVF